MGAGTKGGWSMVVMGVLVLGLVLQAEARSCRYTPCYFQCTKGRFPETCARICDCEPVDDAKQNHFPNSGEPNAVGLGRSCGYSQCYFRCKKSRSPEACARDCDCEPIYAAKHNQFRSSGELCSSGCRSSICGIINTVDGSEEVKLAAMGRCAEACALFCSNGDSRIASTAA